MNEAKKARVPTSLTRRDFLRLVGSGMGAMALSSCGVPFAGDQGSLPQVPRTAKLGHSREHALEAAPIQFEVGGRKVHTWGYQGIVPGPEIRVTEGDTLRVKVANRLPADTTIHWHGLPVPNAMDGVPHITQPPIKSGNDFTYELVVPTAGTYVYHSHVGLQLDRGLYGPLIVEPKKEALEYDREYVLLLDDWLDGIGGTPEDMLKVLQASGGGMGNYVWTIEIGPSTATSFTTWRAAWPACLVGTAKGTSVPELTPREANERVVAGEAVLVDVREESEWETGRIPGSIHVPLSQIRRRGSRGVPEDKVIVLVCRSGARSALAAAMLSDDALKAANLAGGVKAWVREGLPFEETFG